MWACYLLTTSVEPSQTYVGATTDVNRRLRQHNGEISGGAKRTTSLAKHRDSMKAWKRVCHVTGFLEKTDCLSFEWYWKHYSRRMLDKTPLQRRVIALQQMLALDRWANLEVVWELDSFPEIQ